MKKLLIILGQLFFVCNVFAQQTFTMGEGDLFQGQENDNYGNVQIFQDSRIHQLLQNDVDANTKTSLKGWRIQIYFGSGTDANQKANDLKNEFMDEYTEHKAYLEYNAPFFKVRVGDFRNYIDALKFLKNIETKYDNCWIVQDNIEYPNL